MISLLLMIRYSCLRYCCESAMLHSINGEPLYKHGIQVLQLYLVYVIWESSTSIKKDEIQSYRIKKGLFYVMGLEKGLFHVMRMENGLFHVMGMEKRLFHLMGMEKGLFHVMGMEKGLRDDIEGGREGIRRKREWDREGFM